MRCADIFKKHWKEVVLRVWWYVTDTIVPPNDDHVVVRTTQSLHEHIAPHPIRDGVALMRYRDPVVQAFVHEAKFRANRKAQTLLGRVLAAYIQAQYAAAVKVCLIPVPLSGRRFRERGYNQVAEIVRSAQKITSNITVGNRIMRRVRHTRAQTELNRTERKKNLRRAFGVQRGWERRVAHYGGSDVVYVVVDDVATTGTTLDAVRQVLWRECGIAARCIALAH